MKKKKNKFHRSFEIYSPMNVGKNQQAVGLFSPYRKCLSQVASKQWRLFYQTSRLNKQLGLTGIEFHHSLTEYQRYKQTAQYQVVGQLQSWISNLANEFQDAVTHSTLDPQIKKQLLVINQNQMWYDPQLDPELGRLARNIFRGIRRRHRQPSFNQANLLLDAKEAQIFPAQGSSFDYWIKLSTLQLNQPIWLPVRSNQYYEDQPGRRNACLQLSLDDKRKLHLRFVKERPCANPTSNSPKELALDLGLRTFLASNLGDLVGRNFIDDLRSYDQQITNLTRELQKHRQPLASNDRYQRLQARFRAYLKNEVRRCVNRLLQIHQPTKIIIESLNFRYTKLSREMNRLLRRFGLSEFKNKLQAVQEELGITVKYVNPAYTSQTCSKCGYIDAKNRKDEEFKCLFCGHMVHADVGGANNVLLRSSWEESLYISKNQILQTVVDAFILRLERPKPSKVGWKAVRSNPYFKDALCYKHFRWETPSSGLLMANYHPKVFHRNPYLSMEN